MIEWRVACMQPRQAHGRPIAQEYPSFLGGALKIHHLKLSHSSIAVGTARPIEPFSGQPETPNLTEWTRLQSGAQDPATFQLLFFPPPFHPHGIAMQDDLASPPPLVVLARFCLSSLCWPFITCRGA